MKDKAKPTISAEEGIAPQAGDVNPLDQAVYNQPESEPIPVPTITKETKKFRHNLMFVNFAIVSLVLGLVGTYVLRDQLKPYLSAFLFGTDEIATAPADDQTIKEMATTIVEESTSIPPSPSPTPSPTPIVEVTPTPEIFDLKTPTEIKSLAELKSELGEDLHIVNAVTEGEIVFLDGVAYVKVRAQEWTNPNVKGAGQYLQVSKDNNIEGEEPTYSEGRYNDEDGYYYHVFPVDTTTTKDGKYHRHEAKIWMLNTTRFNFKLIRDNVGDKWIGRDESGQEVTFDDAEENGQLIRWFYYESLLPDP